MSVGVGHKWRYILACRGPFLGGPLPKDPVYNASTAGHGGGDYFVMYDFARAVTGEIEPPIDVYDAATWSSIFPISIENVKRNGEPLDIPYFRPVD